MWGGETPESADSAIAMKIITSTPCSSCKDGLAEPFPFTMAFQPIVDVVAGRPYAYEALVRGPKGESAGSVLSQVTDENRYAFDQMCRVKAITLATRLGLVETGARLSINFMPGAVYSPAACIQLTLKTAREVGFPTERLIFEFTEQEKMENPGHLRSIVTEYQKRGFKVAIDDFGEGFAGVNLLADLGADVIKLDMALTRNLPQRKGAQVIVKHLARMAAELGSDLVAEGIETREEYEAVLACGVTLMQGYLLGRPVMETLPGFTLPTGPEAPGAEACGPDACRPDVPGPESLLDLSTKLFRVA